jgi:D-glycero-D-manno-heptose 1,7-bisphosphate phosphatase
MTRAVFLDRDGVLNAGVLKTGRPFAPTCVDELRILPGVAEALARLRAAGFRLVVVTNQPDVSRGLAVRGNVEAIHQVLRTTLPIDEVQVCFHDDRDRCACRKPSPGMLYAAAVAGEIQLDRSFMIGDRWRDISAGRAAGCTTILVNRFDEPAEVAPDVELADLPAAAAWILERDRQS